jgi:spermidine/putrescine transport system substrate-binding protein
MRNRLRPPLSPEAAALLSHAQVSRRTLVRGTFATGALAAAGGALAACGTKGTTQTEASCVSDDTSATDKKLVFSNWPLYIDLDEKDEKKRPTLDAFVAQSGIQVTYNEDINDNNEFFGKIRNQLAACQATDRDIITMTDWMIARLIRLGWLQKLDQDKVPAVGKNLLAALKDPVWDKGNAYGVPWQSGLTAIAYNGKVTKEVRTVDELLTRPDLKGKVTLLSEMRDTMSLLMMSNGHDPATFTEAQFDDALEKLRKAVASGQIRKFTGNDYAQDLAKGDIAACFAWSGDVIQLSSDDEKIKFVAPDSGIVLFSDVMVVPNKAAHKANAEQLMNYYYDPKVAATLAAYVNYICPVQGAQEAMQTIDADLAANPLIFPDAATLAKAKSFRPLDEDEEKKYEAKFQQVTGA